MQDKENFLEALKRLEERAAQQNGLLSAADVQDALGQFAAGQEQQAAVCRYLAGQGIRVEGLEAADLRSVWDTVRGKLGGACACVLATVTAKGTPALIAAGSDEAVAAGFKAGDVIKQIAPLVGGGGGGRPAMAQAGGKNAAGIPDALAAARELLGA